MPDPSQPISAQVIPQEDGGLTIQFTLTGEMEARFRSMMNVIDDYHESFTQDHNAGVTRAMSHVLRIAFDAVDLIGRHKKRLY